MSVQRGGGRFPVRLVGRAPFTPHPFCPRICLVEVEVVLLFIPLGPKLERLGARRDKRTHETEPGDCADSPRDLHAETASKISTNLRRNEADTIDQMSCDGRCCFGILVAARV